MELCLYERRECMKLSQNLASLFLGIWLIASGLMSLTDIHVPVLANIIPLIAIITGLLIILGSPELPKSLGFILLGIWLVLHGMMPFLYVNIPYFNYLVDIVAVAAGILILLRR
jgi:hypothetical protein